MYSLPLDPLLASKGRIKSKQKRAELAWGYSGDPAPRESVRAGETDASGGGRATEMGAEMR
jgi:hypothetical protein